MADVEIDPETEAPPKKKGKVARASIQVNDIPIDTDKATNMMAAASGTRRRGGEGTSERDDRAALQRFSRAIRDPNNKIIATRQQPPVMPDGTALGDTYDIATHESLTEDEIKRDIAEARGARKWILRVYDPEDNIVASRSITVGGEIRLDPMLDIGQAEEPMQDQPTELSEEEILEQTIARDPEVVKQRKNLRLLQLRNEQEEEEAKAAELRARRATAEKAAKGESDNGNGNGRKHRHHDEEEDEDNRLLKMIEASNAPLKAANERMERELAEEKRKNAEKESKEDRRRELEAMTAPLRAAQEATQKSLEAITAKLNAPPPPTGPTTDAIMAKLDAMKAEIKGDTKDQIVTVVNALTSKIDTVATTLNTFMAKGSDPATNALIALATGGNKGGAAAPVDPYAGLERALKALQNLKSLTSQETIAPPDFPSYLVEKLAETTPEVLNFFKEQRGAVPTKEEIDKMMRGAAMKMYENLDASWKTRMSEEFTRLRQDRGLPAPAAAPAPGGAPAGTPATAMPQVSVQPAAPAGAAPGIVSFPGGGTPPAQPAATPAATPAPTPDAVLTPDQLYATLSTEDRAEYAKRINYVLNGLAREMELGIREMGWPQQAQDKLPKAIIDQIVEATKDEDIHAIVRPYADSKIQDKIWGYLSPSHKNHEWYQGWLADGINWIKEANGVEIVDEEGPPVVDDAKS